MSSMSGSEIARLVLGYLQGQQRMDKVALDFCKLSPYLSEEYGILKRGLKIKHASKPKTLLDIIREFIEIEETVNEIFENELDQHENVPNELLRVQSLKDKVQYMFGVSRTAGNTSQLNQCQSQAVASKKRTNVCFGQSENDSCSSEHSFPSATNAEDLPGYIQPLKRQKLYDPLLIINTRPDVLNSDDSTEHSKTPFKSSPEDPTSSKHLEVSASKVTIPAEKLSESIIAHNFGNDLALSINNAFDNGNVPFDQLEDKLAGILSTTEKYPTFDNILFDLCESIEPDQNANESSTDRQLNTPVPDNDANTSARYDLRSSKKTNAPLNVPNETDQTMNNGRAQIISNQLVSNNVLIHSEPVIEIIESDSESAVTTTSKQQAQQNIPQQQPTQFFLFDTESQKYLLLNVANNSNFTQSQPSISSTPTNYISNVIDPSQFTVQDQSNTNTTGLEKFVLNPNQLIFASGFNQETLNNDDDDDDVRNRVIVISKEDVNKEGSQPIQLSQDPPKTTIAIEKAQEEVTLVTEQTNEKTLAMPFLKQIIEPKVVTPKQLIKSNIPCTSRSLSTPRNRNPHVRVLNFSTPNRFRQLSEIAEGKNESLANTSRFFTETPHNRSIVSMMPSSAPSKMNSVTQSEKKSSDQFVESTAQEQFTPADENTNISVEGETPRVRKTNRKSCVRTISAQKEINPEENEKRLKRVAKTKKKICPEDESSNESDKNHKIEEAVKEPVIDAAAEWMRVRAVRNNPELFEQNLREQISKNQEIKLQETGGRKRRSRRAKKNPPTRRVVKKTKIPPAALDESVKSIDTSMNSTLDPDALNSSSINLEARLLEENLRSAKKVTPVKQVIAHKSAKKKTPMSKVQIKLMPSPKNKALKRLKSKKGLSSNQTSNADKNNTPNVTEKPVENQVAPIKPAEPEVNKVNKNIDLEVAQNLISMQEVILQQETQRKQALLNEIQSDSVSMSQPTFETPVCMAVNQPTDISRIDPDLLRNAYQPNLSMSALLETPFKDGSQMLPKTPGFVSFLPQLDTPMFRSIEHLMTDSLLKNPQFPTPSFPITPGSILTPFKNTLSPRGDDVVYGVPNRPTDYSSSSSYYKPDESDGIDKQIRASIHSAGANSGVYSADEINDDSKIDDTTENTMNSSSSSSSSSDSDSDSESDSDSSSSSDSDDSQISQKSPTKEQSTEPLPKEVQSIGLEPTKPQPSANDQPSQPETINEDSTQIIKSHLVTTAKVNIAQNILLSKPETPMKNDEAIRLDILEEKKRRIQESLRQVEMKNHEKLRPRQLKKVRSAAEVKRDRLRAQPVTVSPSKRKSTQPKKIVMVQSRQIYSQVVNVISEPEMLAEHETRTQSTTTERFITDAAGDNAIVDVSDVSTTQNSQGTATVEEEESVEAIESHINKSGETTEDIATIAKETAARKNLSPEGLIDMLSSKQRKFDANKPKMKTEVIAALPLPRTRSRAKKQIVRPVQNILTKPVIAKSGTAKTTIPPDSSKPKPKSLGNSTKEPVKVDKKSAKNERVKAKPTKSEPLKLESTKIEMSSTVASSSKPIEVLDTPAKMKRQMKDLFGEFSDIETPIKSPPKSVINTAQLVASKPMPPPPPPPKETEQISNKFEADSSSNVQDSNSDSNSDSDDDGSSSDDDGYEMILSTEENDKNRFITLRHDASNKTETIEKHVNIGTKNVILDGVKITLAPSDEMELYKQDVHTVARMNKDRQSRKSGEATKVEASSSSEGIFGLPLHTSTPSPSKKLMPKFNIKHKSVDTVSTKSEKKQIFDIMTIEDMLGQLHPPTE